MSNLAANPPFGTYAPNALRRAVIAMTRRQGTGWLGKRLAFALRKLVVWTLNHPLDVEVMGARMRLFPFNNVCEKRILFTPQYFDPEEREILLNRLKPGFVFVDIGANIGGYSLFVGAHAGPGSQVLAIEPQPIIYDRLVYNIAQNPGLGIKALGCALADRNGSMTLFVSPDNKGESSVKILGWSKEPGGSVEVPARTLLGVLEEEGIDRIDAMKIDVEGAEDLILPSFLEEAPDAALPRMVIIEDGRAGWQTDCLALLESRGYRRSRKTRMNIIMERG